MWGWCIELVHKLPSEAGRLVALISHKISVLGSRRILGLPPLLRGYILLPGSRQHWNVGESFCFACETLVRLELLLRGSIGKFGTATVD
jgi:hypothetical protein